MHFDVMTGEDIRRHRPKSSHLSPDIKLKGQANPSDPPPFLPTSLAHTNMCQHSERSLRWKPGRIFRSQIIPPKTKSSALWKLMADVHAHAIWRRSASILYCIPSSVITVAKGLCHHSYARLPTARAASMLSLCVLADSYILCMDSFSSEMHPISGM